MSSPQVAEPLPVSPPRRAPALRPAPADPVMGAVEAQTPWTARATSALQLALATLFVVIGAATLGGAAEVVAPFGTIENVTGLGDGLRVATGALALIGGLLLCVRASAGVGAVVAGVVVAGAAVAELLVFGTPPVWPAVLLAGLSAVAYAHRATLRVVAAVLERNL